LRGTVYAHALVVLKLVQESYCPVEGRGEVLPDVPEFIVFSACAEIIADIHALAAKFKLGQIDEPVFTQQNQQLRLRLRRAAEVTQRFDIVLPVAVCSGFSPFFWQWFNWWFDFCTALTPKQLQKIQSLAENRRKTLTKHRPKGDWLSYRRMPALPEQMIP
jgi:hypothetical protein